MLTRTFHLIPKKSELIFESMVDGEYKSQSSILIYEVDVHPKVSYTNELPLEIIPNQLFISLEKDNQEYRFCNFIERRFDFSVNKIQFSQLMKFFNMNKLPSSIELLIDEEISISDPDEDILERVGITRYTIKFNGSLEK